MTRVCDVTRGYCGLRLFFFYFRQIRTQSTWIFQLFHLSKWDLVFIYCCSKWRPFYLALNDNAPYRSKHSDKSRKTLTRRLTLSLSLFPLHHKKQYFQREIFSLLGVRAGTGFWKNTHFTLLSVTKIGQSSNRKHPHSAKFLMNLSFWHFNCKM